MKANRIAAAACAAFTGLAMAQTGAATMPCPTAERTPGAATSTMGSNMQPSVTAESRMGWDAYRGGGEAGTTGVDMASRPLASTVPQKPLASRGADASPSTTMGANAMGASPSQMAGATDCK